MKFQKHVGLDIGSTFIKAVLLDQTTPDKFKLVEAAIMETPQVENAAERQVVFAEAVKRLLKDGGFSVKAAIISLPEAQVDTRVIEMPFLEENELAAAIRWQAEQYISLPLSDVVLRHQVISTPTVGTPDAKMQVLLVAAPNNIISDYMGIATTAGLDVIGVETEIFSVARSLVATDATSPVTLLVHMGAQATTLSVLRQGDFAFVHNVGTGGIAMTRAILGELGLEVAQAEEYKKTYGLDVTKIEGKVFATLKPLVDLIIGEMQKALAFYEAHHVNTADKVKRIVLSGGCSLLPGFVVYLTEKFSQELQIGNPFGGILLSEAQRTNLAEKEALYSTAVGLAQKLV